MKKLLLILLVFIVVTSCKKSTEEPNDKASFKIEITQTGKFDAYTRLIKTAAGMVFEGTSQSAVIVYNDDLVESKYTFVTTYDLDIFEPAILVGWYGEDAEEGFLDVKIYRNNKLIDTKNIVLKPEKEAETITYTWTYSAK